MLGTKNESASYLIDESPTSDFDSDTPHQKIITIIKNIIDNHSGEQAKIRQKVILLSSVWGGGKTSVLLKLADTYKDSHTWISMDAWNAPKGEIRKQFFRDIFDSSDFQKNSSFFQGYWKGILSSNHLRRTKKDRLIKELDTTETETFAYINPFSFALAILIFVILPLYEENNVIFFPQFMPEVFKTFNYWHLGFAVLLLFIIPPLHRWITSIVFPFWGKVDKYSEYKDDKDFPQHLMEKFWGKYLQDNNQPLIISVDNLDRLSENGQEEYLDSLYHLIEIVSPKYTPPKLSVWVIIAVDKQSIMEKKNNKIELSFFNKLSPYEVALPPLADTSYREMLKTFAGASIARDGTLFKKLYDIFQCFLEQNFPPMLLEKYKPASAPKYTVSPRLIKKYINQILILQNESGILSDNFICGAAVVAASHVFGLEIILEEILQDKYENEIKRASSDLDKMISDASRMNLNERLYELTKEKKRYDYEFQQLNNWSDLLRFNEANYTPFIKMIFYQKPMCSENMIETWLTDTPAHSQTIKEYLEIFGVREIFTKIQAYLTKYLGGWDSSTVVKMTKNLYFIEQMGEDI